MIHNWVMKYIGIPFREHGRTKEGCDCWGLARLIWKEQFGIEVPSYEFEYENCRDRDAISSLIKSEASPAWRPVNPSEVQPGDGILLRVLGVAMHVGVVVDKNVMVHIESGTDSIIEKYTGVQWKKRILGFYRHAEMFDQTK